MTQRSLPRKGARRPGRRPLRTALAGGLPVAALTGLLALGGLAASATLSGCQSAQNLITPASAQARQKGISLYNGGNYAEAAGAFNSAVRQDPRDYQSHYYLGRAYDAMGSYEQAIQAYRTSLEVMHNSLVGRENATLRQKVLDGLASAIAKGDERSAETAALRQKAQPSAEDEFVLAKVFRIHGDADSAIEAYTHAARLDPDNLNIVREFALYLDQLNQAQQAKPELIRAYQLNRKAGKPDDEQVNAALRRTGIVPGPALVEEKDLAHPAVPLGPLPEMDPARLRLQNPFRVAPEPPANPGTPGSGAPAAPNG